MNHPRQFLLKLTENLNILQEREARYAGNAPLDLLNQIDDHHTAITLTERATAGELAPEAWWAELQPLLLPFWQGLSQSVLAALLGSTPAASALREAALSPLRQSPKGALLADEFAADPDTYAKPVQKELTLRLQADAELSVRLHRLLAENEASTRPAGPTYYATIHGSGAIAQGPGAVAAGPGGIAVRGDFTGDITINND